MQKPLHELFATTNMTWAFWLLLLLLLVKLFFPRNAGLWESAVTAALDKQHMRMHVRKSNCS